jgi:gluconate 5-dehydrogenase
MNRFSLENRRALITGSGRGLGLRFAEGLAEAGAKVIINDVDPARAEAAAGTLSGKGYHASTAIFNVTSRDDVRKAIKTLEELHGGVDILVNNAGIHRYGTLLELDLSHWQEVIDVNLTGAFLCAQAVAAGMIQRERGKIINICSLMSEGTRPTTGNYTAAKGGLKMLTKSMTVEWARYNIQANGIGPGYILSDMTQHLGG